MENYFSMDADDELMQKLGELYFNMFNQVFPVCDSSSNDDV